MDSNAQGTPLVAEVVQEITQNAGRNHYRTTVYSIWANCTVSMFCNEELRRTKVILSELLLSAEGGHP